MTQKLAVTLLQIYNVIAILLERCNIARIIHAIMEIRDLATDRVTSDFVKICKRGRYI